MVRDRFSRGELKVKNLSYLTFIHSLASCTPGVFLSVGRVGERWDRGRDLLSVAQLFVMCSITDYILNYFILSPFTSQTITACTLDKCQAQCELDTAGLTLQACCLYDKSARCRKCQMSSIEMDALLIDNWRYV